MLGSRLPIARPLWEALAWMAIITLVFGPLAIARYRRRV
jgi:hypothetical protein